MEAVALDTGEPVDVDVSAWNLCFDSMKAGLISGRFGAEEPSLLNKTTTSDIVGLTETVD